MALGIVPGIQDSARSGKRRIAAHELCGVMAMKFSWFHHHECTTEQADELVASYRRRGATVERSLNRDNITWTVSEKLPECEHPARTPRTFHQKVWG